MIRTDACMQCSYMENFLSKIQSLRYVLMGPTDVSCMGLRTTAPCPLLSLTGVTKLYPTSSNWYQSTPYDLLYLMLPGYSMDSRGW